MLATCNSKWNLKGNMIYSRENGKCHQEWRSVKQWVLGEEERYRWWWRGTDCNIKVQILTMECQRDYGISIPAEKYQSLCRSTGLGHMKHGMRLRSGNPGEEVLLGID